MPILRGPRGKVRLAYCTNVHQGETLEEVEASLARHAARVRERVAPGRALGVGLWLAAPVARELARDAGLARRLRDRLAALGLVAFTANAFPYGGFHGERVKGAVYRPAWDEEARVAYTLDAARALAALLPEGEDEATVSTLPIAWRGGAARDARRLARAGGRVAAALLGLARLREETGRRVRLLFEPEPGCEVETTAEAIEAHAIARAFCEGRGTAEVFDAHAGVCFDCCHQAVIGEDPAAALRRLRAAGVAVGKVHLSCGVAGRIEDLAPLAEPRWLHQVVAEEGGARADDLEAVARDPAWRARRARVHFHVPIYAERLAGGLETTRPALEAALGEALAGEGPAPDLEVETYSWGALPVADRPAELAEGIAREMEFVLARLAGMGVR
jgi:sugar phosphate isomerase/epimerase